MVYRFIPPEKLTNEWKEEFKKLFFLVMNQNYIMSKPYYAIIYPIIITTLLYLSANLNISFIKIVLSVFTGIIAIQINFIFSHIWAHSLMFEYQLWNTNAYINTIRNLPTVMFYAFYHHHHSKTNDWMEEILSYNSPSGAMATFLSHLESFSMFTSSFPIPYFIMTLYITFGLYNYPNIMIPFILGYEIGVVLLPISHDWVHDRKSCSYGILYYLLKPLEILGLFATKYNHFKHHNYDTPTVYKSFTSSGIYSATFDKYIDILWDTVFGLAIASKIRMYVIMYYIMTVTVCFTLICFPVCLSFMY